MSILLHGDCLELMKTLDDESVDLIFCDLPYVDSKGKGQTSCHWNQSAIDLDKFWIEIMRIKKLHTPIFMTTTTKFGVELINSAPKKCHFRYDLVWVKSAPAGFLSAKKMPMRKHEMIYVFYEKLPFYDLSSHTHKFIKEETGGATGEENYETCDKPERKTMYGNLKIFEPKRRSDPRYEPPLPVSIVKEDTGGATGITDDCYNMDERHKNGKMKDMRKTTGYDPPLPVSMLEIKSTRGKHSTEKPVALMSWILKYYSKEGDVVLDPTMGSGSTGIACKNMNRNFIGIEMDAEIYEVAFNRIEDSFV